MQQLTTIELEALLNADFETTIVLFDDFNMHSEIMIGCGRAYTFHDTHLEGVEFEEMQNPAFKEFATPTDLFLLACYASNDEE